MTSSARVCVHRKYSEWKESSESQDLMSNGLQDFIKSTTIIPAIKTDHAAIDLVLTDIGKEAKGPGFWKFNCSLLNDDNYNLFYFILRFTLGWVLNTIGHQVPYKNPENPTPQN